MLVRLSLQNAKRTLGDYAVYVLTVSFMITLDFMLNRLIFSPELSSLTESSFGMQTIFYFTSVIMLIVVFALIKYMTGFILNKRSKEFGLYQLMGIENKRITRIYWIEQCYLGGISITIGIALGLLLGEILRSIVFHYIGCISYQFTTKGLEQTILLTLVEILCAYLLVKLTSGKLFKSRSILSWLQAEKKNEKIKKNSKGRYLLTFLWLTIAIASLAVIAYNIDQISMVLILSCCGVLLISTFGFATCIVRIISIVLLRKDNQFTLRVLPVRFLSKRIATRSRQLGILSMLFVFSLGIMSIGMLFGNYIQEYSAEYEGFDFYYTSAAEDGVTNEFIEGLDQVLQNYDVKDSYVIPGYLIEDCELHEICEDYLDGNCVISLSTYNHVRQMLGYTLVTLEEDEFIIQTHMQRLDTADYFTKEEYLILGKNMKLRSLNITPMNTSCIANGASYYAILPDKMLLGLDKAYLSYAYQLNNKDYEKLAEQIREYVIRCAGDIQNTTIDGYYKELTVSSNFCVTQQLVKEGAFGFAGIAISLLFIGLVFALVLSTILAVLLTSEFNENKQRFLTLHRLGVGLKEQKYIIQRVIVSLFSLPLIIGLPLVTAICMITVRLMETVMTKSYMIINSAITISIFLLIYIIYMIVTYRSLCKGVTME